MNNIQLAYAAKFHDTIIIETININRYYVESWINFKTVPESFEIIQVEIREVNSNE